MFNLHISLLMAFDGLREIVKRFGPDHVNTGSCVYATVGADGVLRASCIVGQFFSDLGILRVLLGVNESGVKPQAFPGDPANVNDPSDLCNLGALTPETRKYLENTFGITMDDAAYTFLRVAQQRQDSAVPWGQAVEDACCELLASGAVTVIDTRTAEEKIHQTLNV